MSEPNLLLPGLTQREQEIMELIFADHNNDRIAEQLILSVRTVETHRKNIMAKTGSKNAMGLLLWALRNGYVID